MKIAASKRLLCVLCMSLLGIGSLPYSLPAAYAEETADTTAVPTITVDTNNKVGAVSPQLFGANHRFMKNGYGMFDPDTSQVRPDFMNAYSDVSLQNFRYPGGAGNLFWWQRAVGNGNGTNPDSGLAQVTGTMLNLYSEPVNFNLDQALKFAEDAGSSLNYMYNMGNGNPTDAANLVHYLNGTDSNNPYVALRIANGHADPYNVKYFELGNEMYLTYQRHWMAGIPAGTSYQSYYVNGGNVSFTKQPVVLNTDWSSLKNSYKSTGVPGQEVYAAYGPVTENTDTVFVNGTAWTRVDSFDGSGPTSQVYKMDNASGLITFGDGTHGQVPPSGNTITVSYSAYHYGYKDFITAMKAVDPSITVLSCLDDAATIAAFGNAGVHYDGVAMHPYTQSMPGNMELNDYYGYLMKSANGNISSVSGMLNKLRSDPLSQGEVYVSEYGLFISTTPKDNPNFVTSLGNALYLGKEALSFMQMGLKVTSKHSLIEDWSGSKPQQALFANNFVEGAGSSNFTQSVSAQMYKILTHMTGTNLLAHPVITSMPAYTYTYNAQTYTNNALDVAATTTDDGDVYLVVINEDPENDYTTNVNMQNYTPDANAAVWTLGENSTVGQYNVEGEPLSVTVQTSSAHISGSSFSYTFPAHTMTAIHMTGSIVPDSKIDDTEATYTGRGWSVKNDTNNYGGSSHITNQAGDEAAYTFTGTGIAWIGAVGSGRGQANVYIDGKLIQKVDAYAPTYQVSQTLFQIVGLPSGTHTIKIEELGTKHPSSSGYWNNVDAFVVNPVGFTKIDDSVVTYTGGWTVQGNSSEYGGSSHVTAAAGEEATYTFTGTGIEWIGDVGSGRGKAEVYMDGNLVQTVNAYASTWKAGLILFSISGLANGSHTLKIKELGTKDPSSSGYWNNIDALIVL